MKTRMITRTITKHEVKVLSIDITDPAHPITADDITCFTGDLLSKDKLLERIKKQCDTDTYKVVSIVDITTTELMYGMTETDFIKSAVLLDTETRKPL